MIAALTDIKAFFYDTSNYSWLRTQETLQKARKEFEDIAAHGTAVRLIVTKNKITDDTDGFWIRMDDQELLENETLLDEYPKTRKDG